MPASFRQWLVPAAKLLLLAPIVAFSAIGVANLAYAWPDFLRAWNDLSARRAWDAARNGAERKHGPRVLEVPKARNPGGDASPRRLGGRSGGTAQALMELLRPNPFPIRKAASILPQRDSLSGTRVDSADMLTLGGGRPFYRENLRPYRLALGGGPMSFIPVPAVRKGAFESIRIFGIKDSLAYALFTLTLNHQSRRVIQRNVELEGEGVFLHSVSPANRYFVVDYGCCPGTRDFEVFDSEGGSVLRGSYRGRLAWEGENLRYLKTETASGPGEKGNPCPGKLDERIRLRVAWFRDGKETVSDSVSAICAGPGE